MWCAILGFVGGLIAAPMIALGGAPVVKRVVKGSIVAGHGVSDWAHARRNDWQNLVQEARTELNAHRAATDTPAM